MMENQSLDVLVIQSKVPEVQKAVWWLLCLIGSCIGFCRPQTTKLDHLCINPKVRWSFGSFFGDDTVHKRRLRVSPLLTANPPC